MAPTYLSSQFRNNSATALTVVGDRPATIANDDLLIMQANIKGTSQVVTGVPTDWNLARAQLSGVSYGSEILYWKIITNAGGEPSSYQWDIDVAFQSEVIIARFSGTDLTTPINQISGQYNASAGSCTHPSVTTTVNDCLLVVLGSAFADSVTFTGGPTQQWDAAGNSRVVFGGTETQTTAGATSSRSTTLNISGASVGGIVALQEPQVQLPGPDADRIIVPTVSRMRV